MRYLLLNGLLCSDLENYTLADLEQLPPDSLPLVSNETIFQWGNEIHERWNHLSKQVEPETHHCCLLSNADKHFAIEGSDVAYFVTSRPEPH